MTSLSRRLIAFAILVSTPVVVIALLGLIPGETTLDIAMYCIPAFLKIAVCVYIAWRLLLSRTNKSIFMAFCVGAIAGLIATLIWPGGLLLYTLVREMLTNGIDEFPVFAFLELTCSPTVGGIFSAALHFGFATSKANPKKHVSTISGMRVNEFVADGYERAVDANEPTVRNEIEAKYATQMENASVQDRKRLQQQIEREIKQRLDELAPPGALYFMNDANPYEPPMSTLSLMPTSTKIRKVAAAQKQVLFALLVNIGMNVASYVVEIENPVNQFIALVVVVLVIGFVVVAIFNLAKELYPIGTAGIFSMLVVIPVVSLIMLVIVNQKATSFLTSNGVKVGLMGARMDQLE